MKIVSSALDLKADHKLEQHKTVNERLRAWVDGEGKDAQSRTELPAATVTLSPEALAKFLEKFAPDNTSSAPAEPEAITYELSMEERELILLLERFLSTLTGKKVKIQIPDKLTLLDPKSNLPASAQTGANTGGSQRAGWGVDYHYSEFYQETETMTFAAQGKIVTEDGRELEIQLNIMESRQYSSYQSIDIKAGDALIDPLVINYGTGSVSLANQKTDFDLDGDGTEEKIPILAPGSGFLALDKNKDGVINDGRELFGPASGNGFAELARYDEDQNNWIDENDPIYKELSIWVKDAAGNDRLLALSQVGIGAIYLGSVDSLFSLKDQDNNLQAQLQRTGIFLKEDGRPGTIQHVDFAV